MFLAGFEPAIPAIKGLQTYALERTATVYSALFFKSLKQNRQPRSKIT
jgi:hypothetical protein